MRILETKELEPIGTNAYFLGDSVSGQAFLVDAPMGAYAWAKALCEQKGFTLTALLLTHGHWDHILDAPLFEAAGIPIFGHPADQALFEKPQCMANFALPGIELKGFQIDQWLKEGDELLLAGQRVTVFEVPGHCPGSLLFFLAEASLAFVGDALFHRGIGRCDLPGGDFAQLEQSIRTKIYQLPDRTILYAGHGPKTSVIEEKRENPFVRS